MSRALADLWRYLPELFEDDAVDAHAVQTGLGPAASQLREAFDAEMAGLLAEANLKAPAPSAFLSTGKRGIHSEHLGPMLAEMQYLQRAYPGGAW